MEQQPDTITIEIIEEDEIFADRADLFVTIKGKSLFTGEEAFKKAIEVRALVESLTAFGITEEDILLLISNEHFTPTLFATMTTAIAGLEGVENRAHSLFTSKADKDTEHQQQLKALTDDNIDMLEYEQDKVKGAIKTDFILSAEIIVIALGTVQDKGILEQSSVVSLIALIMTIGVYGLVAAIVKLDDLGLYLIQQPIKNGFYKIKQIIGKGLLSFAPKLMKTLAIVGTAAMFLVGGGILVHGAPFLHHLLEAFEHAMTGLSWLSSPVFNGGVGIVAGSICLALITSIQAIKNKLSN